MKPHRASFLLALPFIASTGIATAANKYFSAGNSTVWDNSTSNWGTASGTYNTATWATWDVANFEGTGGSVNVAEGVFANGLVFNSDGYVLSGGTINFGNPGGVNLTVASDCTATVNSTVSEPHSMGLYKTGTGTLNLGGTGSSATLVQTYQGTLALTAGSLTVSGDFYVGRNSFGTSDTSLGTFAVSGGSLTVNGANFIMGQTVNGTTKVAQFTQTGGAVSYTGGWMGIGNGGGVSQLDLSGGTFTSASLMCLGVRSGSTLNVSGSALVTLPSLQFFHSNGVTGSGKTSTCNLDGGTLMVNSVANGASSNTSVFNFNGGTLKANADNTGFMSGLTTAAVKSGGAVIDTNGYSVTVGQTLSDGGGGGGLTKNNSGTLKLTAVNGFTGPVTVNGGTLEIAASTSGNASALGSGTNTITVNSGATLLFSSNNRTAGYHSGTVNLNGGTITTNTTDNSLASGHTLTFDVAPGTIDGTGQIRIRDTGATIAVTAAASGSVISVATFTPTFAIAGGYVLEVADGAAANDLTISSSIIGQDGSEGITKTGSGTLALTGNSTYTGATLVSAGTLLVNGSLGTGANVSVSAGATVGGTGTIGGNLTFAPDSFFDIFLSIDNSLEVGGTVSFGAGPSLFGIDNLTGITWSNVPDDTYTLITGTVNTANLDNVGPGQAYDIGGGRSAYFENGSLNLVVIPEPSAALLGLLGISVLARRRR